MKAPFNSLGCGDRFSRQGYAQLRAYIEARRRGLDVIPVWNKSYREHTTVHTRPESVRAEADRAVESLDWNAPYFVDADHISLKNVDAFLEASDFFTLDVADNIGEKAPPEEIAAFADAVCPKLDDIRLPGMNRMLEIKRRDVEHIAENFLAAVQEAGRIYRHIAERKTGEFEVEVSMDETDDPQSPAELLLVLAMIARERIPVDTIAPKFSGRFNKGVDYVGDVKKFAVGFEEDLAVLRFAVDAFGLKETLRLSIHSGSDKFAIYPVMNRIIKKHQTGLHVKTAGTTWLEEMIGLAEAGGSGLAVAKKIYAGAVSRFDELAAPYAAVIDIDPEKLPSAEAVEGWSSNMFVNALRHDQSRPEYNPNFRQLLHLAYKVASELDGEFFQALEEHQEVIGRNVTQNLLERHILPLFG